MDRVRAPTRLAVPCTLDQAAAVRRRLRNDLRDVGLSRDLQADAEIVLGELLGNALLHGTARPDGTVGVDWLIGAESVRVCVTDGGSPPRLRAFDAPNFASSGRGLRIVAELASEWGVELHDPGVTVWAQIG